MPQIDQVPVGTDIVLKGVLKDEDDAALAGSSLSELKWWLLEVDSKTDGIIDTLNGIILTPIGTYVDASGNVTIPVTNARNVIVGDSTKSERHRVVIKFTYSSKIGIDFWDFDVVTSAIPS